MKVLGSIEWRAFSSGCREVVRLLGWTDRCFLVSANKTHSAQDHRHHDVTFWDDESRFDWRSDYRRFDSPRRFDRGVRFRDDRPPRDGGRGRQGRGRGRSSRSVYRSGPPARAAFKQQQTCSRCGGYPHESFNACPAVNQNCRICWKRGHFWKVCHSAVPHSVMGTAPPSRVFSNSAQTKTQTSLKPANGNYVTWMMASVVWCHLVNPNVMRTEWKGLDNDCIYRRCRKTHLAWSLS